MAQIATEISPAFIVGCQRSGTTLLEDILSLHPRIVSWYEPYYVWETFLDASQSDVWSMEDLASGSIRAIREEFKSFAGKSRKPIVVDKTPTHAFNIPILRAVFPNAKIIHILRNGGDVTLSIHREWQKRARIVREKRIGDLAGVAMAMLRRQPFWRYRLMAVRHELGSRLSLDPSRFFNKRRWNGYPGWGPRFEGWQEFLKTHSTLTFNAMQWVKSVEAVRETWPEVPDGQKLEIRYEDLLKTPEKTLDRVVGFLGAGWDAEWISALPRLKRDNVNKWKAAFSAEQIEEIRPILTPTLLRIGYAEDDRRQVE